MTWLNITTHTELLLSVDGGEEMIIYKEIIQIVSPLLTKKMY